jgi:elongation factor 1 alpha-like protein
MSRHKLVKNLDLDDELEDYDGGEDYGDDGDAEGNSLICCGPLIIC